MFSMSEVIWASFCVLQIVTNISKKFLDQKKEDLQRQIFLEKLFVLEKCVDLHFII